MWSFIAQPRARRCRRRRLFASVLFFGLPASEQGSGALPRHAHSHTRTHERALPKPAVQPARAHTRRKKTRQKEKKERGGASHRRQLRELEATSSPGKGSAAAALHPTSGSSICIPAPGNWGEQDNRATRRRTGRSAGAPWPCSLVCGGRSRAPAEPGNEPRASERREPKRGGSRREKGWREAKPGSECAQGSAARLHLAARQTLEVATRELLQEAFLSGFVKQRVPPRRL